MISSLHGGAAKKEGKTKMKKIVACTAVAIAAAAFTGCVSVPGQIADRTKPIEQGRYTVVGDTVSSSVYNISVLCIPLPPIFADSNDSGEMMDNIIDSGQGRLLYHKALEKAPGADALIEYSMDNQYGIFPLPPFIVIGRTTLSGTPVKTLK